MHHINQTQTSSQPTEFSNQSIETFIKQKHQHYRQGAKAVAVRCEAKSPERAASEYKLCLYSIKEKYDGLLAEVEFRLQVEYKIQATRKRFEDLRRMDKTQEKSITSNAAPHRIPWIVALGFFISVLACVVLFVSYPISYWHILSLMSLCVFSIPIVHQVRLGTYSEMAGDVKSVVRACDEMELTAVQNKTQKMIAYAVSLERLVKNMYQEAVRAFQVEYVLARSKNFIPSVFSEPVPPLQFIYSPLLRNWSITNGFCHA